MSVRTQQRIPATRHHHRPPVSPLRWRTAPNPPYGAYRACVRCECPFRAGASHSTVCWSCLTDAERVMVQKGAA